jgi:16S rRNA (guanine527-N7)-methyltransferase
MSEIPAHDDPSQSQPADHPSTPEAAEAVAPVDVVGLWRAQLAAAGHPDVDQAVASLEKYLDLLISANETMNLTRIINRDHARLLHVADAMTLLPRIPKTDHATRLVDVGSGGGVPGLVLAIAMPGAHFNLVEATQKKAKFLTEAVVSLGLANVRIIPLRAEAAGHDTGLRGKADVVTARAVATIDWLVEWCLPLVKTGGIALFQKGPRHVEELAAAVPAIKAVGGGKPVVHPAGLPGNSGHVIVEIPKISRTQPLFPRDATRAKGRPLH